MLAVAPSFSLDNRVVVEAPLGSALLDVHGTSAPATAHSASPFLHTDDYDGHGRPLPSIAPGVSGAASVSPSLMLCEAGGGASAGAPSRIIAPGVGEAMQSSLMRRMTTPLPAVPVKRASLQLFVPHYCTAEEASSSLWPTEEVGDRGREGGWRASCVQCAEFLGREVCNGLNDKRNILGTRLSSVARCLHCACGCKIVAVREVGRA